MIILGVDPGGTTGLVLWSTETERVKFNAQLDFDATCDSLEMLVTAADVCAVERFVISNRTITGSRSGTNDAINLIGVCRYLCRKNGVPMHQQAPADAKAAFNDSVLRNISVYNQVTGGHARDALRHALLLDRKLRRLKTD